MFNVIWQCMGNGRGKPNAETKINMKFIAIQIRKIRPDITARDALAISRLPRSRVQHLRSYGLFNRSEVSSTLRKLRFLGEIS